jgi:hypothetical protein
MLEAGLHAYLQYAKDDRPQTASDLEGIIAEISRVDQSAANMIWLALRENSADDFLAAIHAAARLEPKP